MLNLFTAVFLVSLAFVHSAPTDVGEASIQILEARNTSSIEAVSNCEYHGIGMSKICCGSDFGLRDAYNGDPNLQAHLRTQLQQAFQNSRGNQSPRSLCQRLGGQNVCVSWATYTRGRIANTELDRASKKAYSCAAGYKSTQFYVRMDDQSSTTVCISSVGDRCGVNF